VARFQEYGLGCMDASCVLTHLQLSCNGPSVTLKVSGMFLRTIELVWPLGHGSYRWGVEGKQKKYFGPNRGSNPGPLAKCKAESA
jgi:hypothetical protein